MYRERERKIDALIGFLLGLGAPLGWLAWRFFVSHKDIFVRWLNRELAESIGVYGYMTVGTVFMFSLFGYFLGRRNDSASAGRQSVKESLDKMHTMAMTDALTGLANARHLHDRLSDELESAKRYGAPISCLMFDIDDFKRINDTHGHDLGDVVLEKLAKTILSSVRRVDFVGRLGGEEFLVIMPHTPIDSAMPIAERIREAVQRWPFVIKDISVIVTISIGVAAVPASGVTDEASLLKAADNALYQAKRSGKNRVVMASETVLTV